MLVRRQPRSTHASPHIEGPGAVHLHRPAYNTGTAFEHYDDGVKHSTWLSMMRDRLEAMRELLHEDGLIFVQIDDRELAYLHVLMDEVFGRANRVNLITVKMSEVSGVKMKHVDKRLPKLKEFILVYGRRPDVTIHPIRVTKPPERLAKYLKYYTSIIENPDDPPESWRIARIKHFMKAAGMKTMPLQSSVPLQERHRVVYRTNNRMLARLSFPTATAEVTTQGAALHLVGRQADAVSRRPRGIPATSGPTSPPST